MDASPDRPHRPRRPRRAVRPSGGVGERDESLITRLPTLSAGSTAPVGGARAVASPPARETGVPFRSADDSDVGWGGESADTNDDRLQRDKPPHW